jgi:hypothetical protein
MNNRSKRASMSQKNGNPAKREIEPVRRADSPVLFLALQIIVERGEPLCHVSQLLGGGPGGGCVVIVVVPPRGGGDGRRGHVARHLALDLRLQTCG